MLYTKIDVAQYKINAWPCCKSSKCISIGSSESAVERSLVSHSFVEGSRPNMRGSSWYHA